MFSIYDAWCILAAYQQPRIFRTLASKQDDRLFLFLKGFRWRTELPFVLQQVGEVFVIPVSGASGPGPLEARCERVEACADPCDTLLQGLRLQHKILGDPSYLKIRLNSPLPSKSQARCTKTSLHGMSLILHHHMKHRFPFCNMRRSRTRHCSL